MPSQRIAEPRRHEVRGEQQAQRQSGRGHPRVSLHVADPVVHVEERPERHDRVVLDVAEEDTGDPVRARDERQADPAGGAGRQ